MQNLPAIFSILKWNFQNIKVVIVCSNLVYILSNRGYIESALAWLSTQRHL